MTDMPPLHIGLIMAGGSGERFWPLSRRLRPKQLLPLTRPDKSMLAEAIDHIAPVVKIENVYIVTGAHLVQPIQDACLPIPASNIIAEPCKRNTAGALCYAAAVIMARHHDRSPDDITLAITTADHRIGDAPRFAETVALALEAAERHDSLVTCGIRPAYPETGFGYIETDNDSPILLEKDEGLNVCRARAFHEKPTLERAKEFLASGRHLWNSGMFFWKLSVFLQELQKARPVMATLVQDLTNALLAGNQDLVAYIFEQMENISIDFALMEKSDRVLVVSGSFPWADVGSWNAIATPDKTDDHGNYVVGNPIVVECNNCVVYNDAASPKMAVGVAGMTNTVVVVTEDAVLVLPKDRAQEVRAIVDELKRRNAEQL